MNLKNLSKIALLIVLFVMIGAVSVNASVSSVSNVTFDPNYYVGSYADVAKVIGANEPALKAHFEAIGVSEGRAASIMFDIKYYVANNPDVASAYNGDFEACYEHFMRSGINERRLTSPVFNVATYLDNNPDVASACKGDCVAAYTHFATAGINEKRITSTEFNINDYLANNSDVANSCGDNYVAAYNHYLQAGINENRVAVKHVHSWTLVETAKPATCKVEGEGLYKCSCGETKTDVIAKTEHVWDEGSVTSPATCAEEGLTTYNCIICLEKKYEVIDKVAHTFNLNVTPSARVSATCTENGRDVYLCTVCGNATYNEISDALGHDFLNESCTVSVTKAPKCYEEGEKTISCIRNCGETVKKPVAKVPHNFDTDNDGTEEATSDDVVTVATCTSAAYIACNTEGCPYSIDKVGAKGTIATDKKLAAELTDTQKETFGLAAHDWDNGEVTVAATCGAEGELTKTCSVCEGTKTEAIPITASHDYKYAEGTRVPATCTSDGSITKICKVCGNAVAEKLPAGHDWYYISEPTCKLPGEGYCRNENCPQYYHQATTIPATGHDWTVVTEATCTSAAYIKCANCDEFNGTNNSGVLATSKTLEKILTAEQKAEYAALGHDFEVITEANCITAAYINCKNEGCDYKDSAAEPTGTVASSIFTDEDELVASGYAALGHTYEVVTPATCTANAMIKCSVCDALNGSTHAITGEPKGVNAGTVFTDPDELEESGYKALGHTYQVVTPATCTVNAMIKCSVCNALNGNRNNEGKYLGTNAGSIFNSYITPTLAESGYAATNHEWVNDKVATCTETGLKHCSNPGCDQQKVVVPAIGHKYGAWTTIDGVKRHVCGVCGNISVVGAKKASYLGVPSNELYEGKLSQNLDSIKVDEKDNVITVTQTGNMLSYNNGEYAGKWFGILVDLGVNKDNVGTAEGSSYIFNPNGTDKSQTQKWGAALGDNNSFIVWLTAADCEGTGFTIPFTITDNESTTTKNVTIKFIGK